MAATDIFKIFDAKLEPDVQKHLKNVYSCVSMSLISAAAGAYACLRIPYLQGSLLVAFAAIGFFFAVFATEDSPKTKTTRLLYLLGGAACVGHGLGPILSYAMIVNPSIIVTALIGTTFVFISFTLAAMLSTRGSYLALGGTLMSAMSIMFYLLLAMMFTGSSMLFNLYTYIALFAACGFILYDTQFIIEKRRAGSKDYVADAVKLFIDFIDVFRHLVVILLNKEKGNNNRRKD